jgi:pyridoxal phosphate enzyme (YggS family)
MSIAENIGRIRDRIQRAARHAARRQEEICLMGVTKTMSPEQVREAYAAGIRLFGENRVQEFAGKVGALRDLEDAEWHMIGHLQSNKAARVVELFDATESLDSVRLAEKLNAAAAQLKKKLPVLVEINIGGEEAKSGLAPDSAELDDLLNRASQLTFLDFRGLMTVPPYSDNPEHSRPYFRRMRQIRDAISARKLPAAGMDVLSMGMSHDFEVAVEEGSTCVRIGTAIFGKRKTS